MGRGKTAIITPMIILDTFLLNYDKIDNIQNNLKKE